MAVASPERLREDLVRLIHRSDPATLLPTDEVVENGLPPAAFARMAEIEIGGGDYNAFSALASSGTCAASLSGATEGDLDRSRRHREVRRPNGFGDELRVVLVDDASTWGGLTLLRAAGSRAFTAEEAALIASLSGSLAEGVRRALLVGALAADQPEGEAPAGLVLLAPDNSVTLTNDAADEWLSELPGDPLTPAVAAVASRARSIADGTAPAGATARARVRTAAGRWLLIRGSTLGEEDDAPTAVIIEAARPHELAPLIADAYGLTDRERAVTQLIAQGLPTNAIADRLYLSPWTVQDHLKAIFEKVGVGSRGELVARLFFEHYAPRLSDAP